MISSSGSAKVLRPKRKGNGLSRFTSDARITSFCDDGLFAGDATIQVDYPVRHECKGFAVVSIVVEERLLYAWSPETSQRCLQTIASSPDAVSPTSGNRDTQRSPSIHWRMSENRYARKRRKEDLQRAQLRVEAVEPSRGRP